MHNRETRSCLLLPGVFLGTTIRVRLCQSDLQRTISETSDDAQIDELHKMSALMGPPTMQSWPEGVLLAAGMGFSFHPQQPIPLHLMVGFQNPIFPLWVDVLEKKQAEYRHALYVCWFGQVHPKGESRRDCLRLCRLPSPVKHHVHWS